MAYLPVNLRLDGRPCTVIGGGPIAEGKVAGLLAAAARVTVIAPDLTPTLAALAETHEVIHHARAYRTGDLVGAFLAIAATDDIETQRAVAAEADAARVLVNVVDRPALCSFIFPAILRRGPLTVAVSTGGTSPALARHLRDTLADQIGTEHGRLARILGALRKRLPPGPERGRLFAALVRSPLLEHLRHDRLPEVDALLQRLGGPACALARLDPAVLDPAGDASAGGLRGG